MADAERNERRIDNNWSRISDIEKVQQRLTVQIEEIHKYLIGSMSGDGLKDLIRESNSRTKANEQSIEELKRHIDELARGNKKTFAYLWLGLFVSLLFASISTVYVFAVVGG